MTTITSAPFAGFSWIEKAHFVADYHARHGRFPAKRSSRYGEWLHRQRVTFRRHGALPHGRHLILDELAPTWKARPATWYERVQHTQAFLGEHGLFPNPRSTDKVESSLGRWIENQRFALLKGNLADIAAFILDNLTPGWRTRLLDRRWDARHQVVAEFNAENGRLPGYADDYKAAEWIEKQSATIPTSGRTDREAAIDAKTPGLIAGVAESKWMANAVQVAEFQKGSDRLPSRNTGPRDERILGLWLHNQRTRLNGDTARGRARITFLNTFVEGWRGRTTKG